MHTHLEDGPVLDKTLELCQTIVSQPEFAGMQKEIQAFLGNEDAKRLYQTVVEKGEALHQKQHQGVKLSDTEVSEYDQHRTALMAHPVASGFLAAQEQMHTLADSVSKYVNKTMELGRVPSPEDFESCGSGCSCGH